jgi:hypothetical protein
MICGYVGILLGCGIWAWLIGKFSIYMWSYFTVIYALVSVCALRQNFSNSPCLVIDDHGIESGTLKLPWSEISTAELNSKKGKKVISLNLPKLSLEHLSNHASVNIGKLRISSAGTTSKGIVMDSSNSNSVKVLLDFGAIDADPEAVLEVINQSLGNTA